MRKDTSGIKLAINLKNFFAFIAFIIPHQKRKANLIVLSSYDSRLSGLSGKSSFTKFATGVKSFKRIPSNLEMGLAGSSRKVTSVTMPRVPCEPTISLQRLKILLLQTFQR